MEDQNLNQQNPSDVAQENQPKSATPQKSSPNKISTDKPVQDPTTNQNADSSLDQNSAEQPNTLPQQSSENVQDNTAVQQNEPNPQNNQQESSGTENNNSRDITQDQTNPQDTQIISQNRPESTAASQPKENKGPRISFYGSCECDQFYVDGVKFIIRRPFEITSHFTEIDRTVYSVVCGGLHTLILLTNGEVYTLGCNDDGALGREGEESRPAKVDLPVPIDMISAGDSHSIACNSANSMIFQWGVYRNVLKGNISKVTTPHRIGEKELGKKNIKKVLSGANHTLVLAEEKVYVWGDPEGGILGRLPTGRRMFQQGLNIEALAVRHVENIFTGAYHSFLVHRKKKNVDDAEDNPTMLLAWGLNNFGQLGLGTTENMHVPTEIEEFNGVEIKDIRGGEHHTILLTADGLLYGFGKNDEGQIGVGDIKEKLKEEAREEARAAREEAKAAEEAKKKKAKEGENKEKMVDEAEEKKAEEKKTEEKKIEVEEEVNLERITKPANLSLKNVDKIFSGSNFNYAIDKENKIYSWGMGENYVLGNREEDTVEEPTVLEEDFYKGKAILFGLGAQHVVSLVVNDAAVTLELDEEVLKTIEKTKKKPSATKTKAKKDEEETEDKEEKEEKKESKRGRGKAEKKEDKIEEEEDKEEEKKSRARGRGKAKEQKQEEIESEDDEDEEKKSKGRGKTKEKKGKVEEKTTSKGRKAKEEKKGAKPATERNGRKRRIADKEEDTSQLKKVKKTTNSKDTRSKSAKSDKKSLKSKKR